jgi:hypothetical protein
MLSLMSLSPKQTSLVLLLLLLLSLPSPEYLRLGAERAIQYKQ